MTRQVSRSVLLARRCNAEKRFRLYGVFSIILSLTFLFVLFSVIFSKGYSAFIQTSILLDIRLENTTGTGIKVYRKAVHEALLEMFPEVKNRREKQKLYKMLSNDAPFELRSKVRENPELGGRNFPMWFAASARVDCLEKSSEPRESATIAGCRGGDLVSWIDNLAETNRIDTHLGTRFLTNGDSRDPESAGIFGALKGSLMTIFITIILSFPIGVATAVYLEEFAPTNRLTDLIEVSINNLAAVPSIIFGILGLAVFINFFGLPRSSALVGGMVLAQMTLPTIIIASRASLKSVPSSIRDAARALGASPIQVVFHHTVPLAMPGMLTGSIIGIAQAIGETAPLLLIGMVAFIVDPPSDFSSPASSLPVQIFLWSDSPERGFAERAAGAIIVLLLLLGVLNSLAVILRKKFEKHW